MQDLVLPAFEMDCREWLVTSPSDLGLSEDADEAPLLALLSTVIVGDTDLREASGRITMGLLDDDPSPVRPIGAAAVAVLLDDPDCPADLVQYVLPAPDGLLGLLAEFRLPAAGDVELTARVESLMASFRWAA